MIELEDVSLSFGDMTVLDEVDLTVEAGEFVAVVGPNGAGKTTLLRTINGLLTPDSGTVTLDGQSITSLSQKEVSQIVATVPQDTHIGFTFTAEQIVEMGRTPHRSRLDWTEGSDPIGAAMERTETLEFRDRNVDELSGGERQRVLLARALAQEPKALLLDEPTASLDINHQIRVLGLVSDLVAEGKAALAAIHDLQLAARFCDRLLLLNDGTITASGPPESVLSDPTLADAFETETAVTTNPVTGTPAVSALEARPQRSGHVHVVGGGAGASAAIRALWKAGLTVTVGIIPDGDVAAHLASQLEIPIVTAPPFETPNDDKRKKVCSFIQQADLVVLTGGATEETLATWTSGMEVTAASNSEVTANAGSDQAGVTSSNGTANIESGATPGTPPGKLDTPYIRAELGGSAHQTARHDGGELTVALNEATLVESVLKLMEEQKN